MGVGQTAVQAAAAESVLLARCLHLQDRRGLVAHADRAADQQAGQRLPATGQLGIGGVAEVGVMVVPHRCGQFHVPGHRRHQFGERTQHVARAMRGHLGRIVAEAHFAALGLRQRTGPRADALVERTDAGTQLHRTRGQHKEFGAAPRFQSVERRAAAVPVAGVLRVGDRLPRLGALLPRQRERVDHRVQRLQNPAVVAIAIVQAAAHRALRVRVGDVVVPGAQRPRDTHHRVEGLGAVVRDPAPQVGEPVAGQHAEIALAGIGVVVAASRHGLIEVG